MPDITPKNYIIISVIVGIVFMIVAQAAGVPISNYLNQLRADSVAVGIPDFIAATITEPWRWLLSQPLMGAVITGLMWPFVLVWFLLGFVLMVWQMIAEALAYSRQGITQG